MSEETPDVSQQQAAAATAAAAAGQAPQPTPNYLANSSGTGGAGGAAGAVTGAGGGAYAEWEQERQAWARQVTLCNRALRDAPPEGKALAKVQLAEAEVGLAKEELRLVPAGDEAVKLEKERALAKAEYELAKAERVVAPGDAQRVAEEERAWKAYEALLPTAPAKRARLTAVEAADSTEGPPTFVAAVLRKVQAQPDWGAADPKNVAHVVDFGTPIWGNGAQHTSMMVRAFYPTFVRWIDEVVQQRSWRLVLAGSKGIGKSFFGVYLLMPWLREGRIVVYDNDGCKTMLVPRNAHTEALGK